MRMDVDGDTSDIYDALALEASGLGDDLLDGLPAGGGGGGVEVGMLCRRRSTRCRGVVVFISCCYTWVLPLRLPCSNPRL